MPQLRKAKQQAGQARAASSLSAAYRRASRSLSGLSVSPAVRGANTALVAALEKTEAAYARLAAAARRGSRGGYNVAREDVRAGEAAVKRALRQVQRAS